MAINTKEIFEKVKANQAKLAICNKHNFQRMYEKVFSKYQCTKCGGTVDGINAIWYIRGLVDGAK